MEKTEIDKLLRMIDELKFKTSEIEEYLRQILQEMIRRGDFDN